jgi:hypothetical protein
MADKIDRIETKIDSITDKIEVINQTLIEQHESLKYHIRRTDILEGQVVPLVRHDTMLRAVVVLITYLGITLGILEALVRMKVL